MIISLLLKKRKGEKQAMVGVVAHLSQIKPGTLVLDTLRCRRTILEIVNVPQETLPALSCTHIEDEDYVICSSWLVQVRDLRTRRIDTTRIDCDAMGLVERFHLLESEAYLQLTGKRG
jgi:hypothetical protein